MKLTEKSLKWANYEFQNNKSRFCSIATYFPPNILRRAYGQWRMVSVRIFYTLAPRLKGRL